MSALLSSASHELAAVGIDPSAVAALFAILFVFIGFSGFGAFAKRPLPQHLGINGLLFLGLNGFLLLAYFVWPFAYLNLVMTEIGTGLLVICWATLMTTAHQPVHIDQE